MLSETSLVQGTQSFFVSDATASVGDAEGMLLGRADGFAEGSVVGTLLGRAEGTLLGREDGFAEGSAEGTLLGREDGLANGCVDGAVVGEVLGSDDGEELGDNEGLEEGRALGPSVRLGVIPQQTAPSSSSYGCPSWAQVNRQN